MFIKDTSGNRSLTATVVVIGFFVVMVKVLLSGASVSIGSSTYSFGTIDGFTAGAILTSTLGSYTARRWGGSTVDVQGSGGKPRDGAA